MVYNLEKLEGVGDKRETGNLLTFHLNFRAMMARGFFESPAKRNEKKKKRGEEIEALKSKVMLTGAEDLTC